MVRELRKTVRFHRVGGSKAVVVPKDFLAAFGFDDNEAELVLVKDGILLTPKATESSLDEPEFVQFLNFLETANQRFPGRLRNVLDLTAEDGYLVEGIVLDD